MLEIEQVLLRGEKMTNYGEAVETVKAVAELVIAFGTVLGIYLQARNRKEIKDIYHATNSMKDELVEAVRSEATQLGIVEGRRQSTDELS